MYGIRNKYLESKENLVIYSNQCVNYHNKISLKDYAFIRKLQLEVRKSGYIPKHPKYNYKYNIFIIMS